MKNKEEKALIQISNLQFSYNEKSVLKNIDIEVYKKDFISIVGPNGAGKTTLLKCLNRLLTKTQGEIYLEGKRMERYSQKELAQKISYVPQATPNQLLYTVYEFVLMSRYPYLTAFSIPRRSDETIVLEALKKTGAIDLKDRHLKTLSGGECQRVFIAAALAQDTEVVLLDEPATFLDPKYQVEVYHLLKKLNQEDELTLVMVTHDINNAVRHSTRILGLQEGTMLYWGDSKEFMKKDHLQKIFMTSFYFIDDPQTGCRIAIPEI